MHLIEFFSFFLKLKKSKLQLIFINVLCSVSIIVILQWLKQNTKHLWILIVITTQNICYDYQLFLLIVILQWLKQRLKYDYLAEVSVFKHPILKNCVTRSLKLQSNSVKIQTRKVLTSGQKQYIISKRKSIFMKPKVDFLNTF